MTGDELRTAARRIVTAKKLYNIREGWTAAEDTLPRRFLAEGLPSGTSQNSLLPRERLEEMIQAYYRGRQWDEEGMVPERTLRDLDLLDLEKAKT